MVPAAAWLTMLVLPQVNHLVHHRGRGIDGPVPTERRRAQSDLMARVIGGLRQPASRKKPSPPRPEKVSSTGGNRTPKVRLMTFSLK